MKVLKGDIAETGVRHDTLVGIVRNTYYTPTICRGAIN